MCCVSFIITDISIAAVDLLQEMTDVESDEDNEDAINAVFDALVGTTVQVFIMPVIGECIFAMFHA